VAAAVHYRSLRDELPAVGIQVFTDSGCVAVAVVFEVEAQAHQFEHSVRAFGVSIAVGPRLHRGADLRESGVKCTRRVMRGEFRAALGLVEHGRVETLGPRVEVDVVLRETSELTPLRRALEGVVQRLHPRRAEPRQAVDLHPVFGVLVEVMLAELHEGVGPDHGNGVVDLGRVIGDDEDRFTGQGPQNILPLLLSPQMVGL